MLQTPHYQLPVYEPNDPTTWLVTFNNAMNQIDTAMYGNEENITKNATDISGLEQQMGSANDEINELTGEVSDLKTLTTGHTSEIAGLQNTVSNQNNTIAAISTKVDGLETEVGTIYRGVLTANEDTIAVQIGEFTQQTLVDVYTSVYGFNPSNVELRPASGGQPNICVLTFDTTQSEDVDVAVMVR